MTKVRKKAAIFYESTSKLMTRVLLTVTNMRKRTKRQDPSICGYDNLTLVYNKKHAIIVTKPQSLGENTIITKQ
jgi:hypothetical protein